MARYPKGHKEEIRLRILSETRRIVAEQGPAALSIAMLMQNIGLTHGGFYTHFESREHLLAEAVSTMCSTVLNVFNRLAVGENSWDGLLAYIDIYLSSKHRDSVVEGCPVSGLGSRMAMLPLDNRNKFAAAHRNLQGAIAVFLERHAVTDAPALASSVLAEMVGAITLARALGKGTGSDLVLSQSREEIRQRLLAVRDRTSTASPRSPQA